MKRRKFLKAGLLGFWGMTGRKGLAAAPSQRTGISRTPILRRDLGRTGERLSILGLGGVTLQGESPDRAAALVQEAVAHGINYFDVAPSYGDAEDLLGPALKPFREDVFLACKTQNRDRQGAQEELESSLVRLQTDRIDLYQLHALTTRREVERALGWRGAMEAVVQAKEQGKVRFVGFSAHSEEAALRAIELFDFDTILFPVNFVCYFKSGFGPEVVERARSRGIGVLAIKALARQPWPDESMRGHWQKSWYQPVTAPEEADLALRFTLSQPVTAAVPPGDIRLFRRALETAHAFTPLNDGELKRLRRLSEGLTPLFPLEEGPK
jgi:aryl-alcohol dehydrogenase-like predicted oxidoreductase